MEAESKSVNTVDQTELNTSDEVDGYVSPEVAAAMSGERVEFGVTVVVAD